MGTRIVKEKVVRGGVVVGLDGSGEVYATLLGEPVPYADGTEVVREGTLDGRPVRSTLRMDTVGPEGRQAARFIYSGEVKDESARTAGTHHLMCWVPLPGQKRRFEVAEDGFESARHASVRRGIRLGLLATALLAILWMLYIWFPGFGSGS